MTRFTTPPGDEFPTCGTCGARNVEDAGDHADRTGHWPVPAPAPRVHLGEPFPFPVCGYLGPDLAPGDHLPVIHVTADRAEATCPDCLDPHTATQRAADAVILSMVRLGAVPTPRCGYTLLGGTRCIAPAGPDSLCEHHSAGMTRILEALDLPGGAR